MHHRGRCVAGLIINEHHHYYAACPVKDDILIDVGITGWLRREDALKLYEMAFFAEDDILELGCGKGLSTSILAQAAIDRGRPGRILTIDINPVYVKETCAILKKLRLHQVVNVYCGHATKFCRELVKTEKKFAFVFVDHSHDYHSVLAVCRELRDLISEGGLCLFHDYNDPRNQDPANTDYEVYQAVRDGLSSSAFEFFGIFGCSALFRRKTHLVIGTDSP
jgi:predicted O-methyltransferase YrrM